jgi:hypothetical protein
MGIETKTIGQLVDELITTNIKCFMAQDNRDYENAQQLNKRRCDLVRAIDKMSGQGENSPTGKTY